MKWIARCFLQWLARCFWFVQCGLPAVCHDVLFLRRCTAHVLETVVRSGAKCVLPRFDLEDDRMSFFVSCMLLDKVGACDLLCH